MATYSYNPINLESSEICRMRLELGDTTFAPGELTAALSDEEYRYILKSCKGGWRQKKIKCLDAILMRFAHQVDFSVDGVSYSFSQRVDFWKNLRDELKKNSIIAIPTGNSQAMIDGPGGSSYFHTDLHANPRK